MDYWYHVSPYALGAKHHLRILHLSDLHERCALDWMDEQRQNRIRLGDPSRHRVLGPGTGGGSIAEILQRIRKDRVPDLVCFTGDVADWGLKEEYGKATGRIKGILSAVGTGLDRFFVVPGNHDVSRKSEEEAWREMRRLTLENTVGASSLMANTSVPYGAKAEWREAVLRRSATFWNWVRNDLGRAHLEPRQGPHGQLGYRETLNIPDLPFPVHVIGLDSAWLAGDDNDARKLLLTTLQVDALTHDRIGPLTGFRLALMHHPLSDLHDETEVEPRLADGVHLLLRGHQHRMISREQLSPERELRELAAGSLYEGDDGDRWVNGFHVVDVYLTESGDPVLHDVELWGWSTTGLFWHHDNAIYKSAENGRLRLLTPLGKELAQTTRGSPRNHMARLETLVRQCAPDCDTIERLHQVAVPKAPCGASRTHWVPPYNPYEASGDESSRLLALTSCVVADLHSYLVQPRQPAPVCAFVSCLLKWAESQRPEMAGELRGWIDEDQQLGCHTDGQWQQGWQVAGLEATDPRLLVVIHPDSMQTPGERPRHYLLEARLWRGSPEPVRQDNGRGPGTIHDMKRAFTECVVKTPWPLSDWLARLGIDFILPDDLLSEPVDWWPVEDEPEPRHCGAEHPVVVRPRRRVYNPSPYLRKDHREAWHTLQNDVPSLSEQFLWVTKVPPPDEIEFPHGVTCVGFTFDPTSDKAGRDVLNVVIHQGIPVALWLRSSTAEPLLEDDVLRQMRTLLPKRAEELPERVRSLRKDNARKPAALGSNLVLLWDDPYCLPTEAPPPLTIP